MRTPRLLRLLVALAGITVILAGSRLTDAYYSSSTVARTGVFATGADQNVVVASCSATGGGNRMNFYWSPIALAAKYEVWVEATSATATSPSKDPLQTIVVTSKVPDTYKSIDYQYTGNATRWAYIKAFDSSGAVISQSNHIEYRKNSNTAGTCLP